MPSWLSRARTGLVTREDPSHAHKVLGLSCLVHFAYRFVQFGRGTPDMGFEDGGVMTLGCVCLHAALSCSSLIFKLPARRIKEGSRIWPEYRLHSIVFAVRSLACMAVTALERLLLPLLLLPGPPQQQPLYFLNYLIVVGACAAADAGSRSVGDASRSSTIRELAAPPALRFFFSVMQFHATTGCLVGLRSLSTQFIYLFIVQITAFAMTLRRKNLVGHAAFVLGYSGLLVFGFGVATLDALGHGRWALVNAVGNCAALGRLALGLDKYALWTGAAVAVALLRDSEAAQRLWAPLWAASTAALLVLGVARCGTASKSTAAAAAAAPGTKRD